MKPLLIVLMLFGLSAPVWADSSGCPLTGVREMCTFVNVSDPGKTIGIDEKAYHDQIDMWLRSRLIKISKPEDNINNGVTLIVGVDLEGPCGDGVYTYSITGELQERTHIDRMPKKPVYLTTWSYSDTFIGHKYEISEAATASMSKLIDEFRKDFENDNPPHGMAMPIPSAPAK